MNNKNISKESIKNLQNHDPLDTAEKIIGDSYKTNEEVSFLGLLLQIDKSEKMNQIMDSTDDTKFSETTEEYLRKVTDFGFEVVYQEDFKSDGIDEKFFILWHKKFSILLCFDTYRGNRNGGNFYYNWSPNERESYNLTQSGSWKSLYMDFTTMQEKPNPEPCPRWENESWDEFKVIQTAWDERNTEYVKVNNLRRIWVGYNDCREAIKNQISLMEERGIFLNKWIETPSLWLSHHGDKTKKDEDYNSLIKRRFEQLPQFVKDCITVVKNK